MYNSGIYLSFDIAMVTKNGQQYRLKIEKLPLCGKFKASGDRFLRIGYQHKLTPKKLLI